MARIKSFEPVFGGRIELVQARPGMVWADPAVVRRHMATLIDKPVDVVIRVVQARDVRQMQKYWWACPVPLLAEHCGYTDNQMHYVLLEECFGVTIGPRGMRVPNQPHSAALNFDQWRQLIDWVLIWGPTELDVVIPPPQKVQAAA